MAYSNFAWYYDVLNVAADYNKLTAWLIAALQKYGINGGLLADLGCGTGEVSMRLANAGYDVIGVDASVEMLSVFREKLALQQQDILLLNQDLAELDLYGTIKAAVSCFDTINHIAPNLLEKALAKVALFLEPDGIFVFDINTPYKHKHVLGGNMFQIELEDEGIMCVWQNSYDANKKAVKICIEAQQNNIPLFAEEFYEYDYDIAYLQDVLEKAGMQLLDKCDGESFGELHSESQRAMLIFRKA